MARVLVTRPLDEARRTAKALQALGHQALIAPMLTIAFRAGAGLPAGPFDRIIVTSGNALAALHERFSMKETSQSREPQCGMAGLLHIPLLAVGRRTADAARAMGFALVETPGRDLIAMLAHVERRWHKPQRVLYVTGSDHTGDLRALLAPFGHSVFLAVLYDAIQATAFEPDVLFALKEAKIDTILHYSARTAAAYVDCARAGDVPLAQRQLCLSRKVADVLAEAGARHIAIAAAPDEKSLLALL